MQKVITKKRLLGARKKGEKMQYLMDGTTCWMDDNRAKYLAALGEVEIVDVKSKSKKPASAPVPEEPDEDTEPDDKPDL